jgi:hypothetical protein
MGDNRPPEQIMAHLQAQCRELERQLHMSIDAERKAQNQIQQLQLMSKSQTAILRTNLSHKIEDREKLLDEALEALDSAAASSSSSSSSKSGEGGEAGGSPGAQTTTTTSATNETNEGGGDGVDSSGDDATKAAPKPSVAFREELKRLQAAKGKGMDADGALRQVQVEVEELRRQNAEYKARQIE